MNSVPKVNETPKKNMREFIILRPSHYICYILTFYEIQCVILIIYILNYTHLKIIKINIMKVYD